MCVSFTLFFHSATAFQEPLFPPSASWFQRGNARSHILECRFMLQRHWTLIHFTTDSRKAKYFSASEAPGVPAVKKSLSSLRLWCLLKSECLTPWLRCTQQLFIPIRRVLAPQLSSTQAGWLFCAGAGGSDILLSIGTWLRLCYRYVENYK